jgi:dTMP kinase
MFLTFEGMEGCGKSTQCKKMIEYFVRQGHDVLHTLEPGGSPLGKELRRILLDPRNTDLSSVSELFLYLADRAQHVAAVIRPAIEDGRTVICDRFADSTVVYQGYGRGLDPALLRQLNDVAVQGLWPDVTVLLDVEPGNRSEAGPGPQYARQQDDNRRPV